MKQVTLFLVVFGSCSLMPVATDAQAPAVSITEFVAANVNGLDDEDRDEEDWIEIHNGSASPVDLGGWFLTDNSDNLTKWMFPSTVVSPGGYLVVFASNKDRRTGELHTNFQLDDEGEYLALVMPDGATVASEFAPAYPVQAPDYSYGPAGVATEERLLGPGAPARAHVPTDASLEPEGSFTPDVRRPWTLEALDESRWMIGTTGIGFAAGTSAESPIGLDVSAMQGVNTTVYVRIPFTVTAPSTITNLTLHVRHIGGLVAYVNGHEVARDDAPEPWLTTWNSAVPDPQADARSVESTAFDISEALDVIRAGSNLLAIQGLKASMESDFLLLPELTAIRTAIRDGSLRYFAGPTPGKPNGPGLIRLGPVIDQTRKAPEAPAPGDEIRVSASIRPVSGTIAAVRLRYRVGFGPEVSLPMAALPEERTGAATTRIYTATIPAAAASPGAMVRWFIVATDTMGGHTRLPAFAAPTGAPEYFGTVVEDPAIETPLPTLHWFIEAPDDTNSEFRARSSFFFEGEFYDNLTVKVHGQTSAWFPKKSYDVDFHPGHNFVWREDAPRADDVNLLTTYADKTQMRNILAYETYRDAGSAYHWVIPVRVQRNGEFWGTAHLMENGDEDWLVRLGVDVRGALYKMNNDLMWPANVAFHVEKKTRKDEPNTDLQVLFDRLSLTDDERIDFLYDNVDVPSVVNFLAARTLTGDVDCCHKNYYLYRDTEGSHEWQMWAWDVDLSFGRRFSDTWTSWDQNLVAETPLFVGDNNRLVNAIYRTPAMRAMYLRRVRTLMDDLLKPPGTPAEALYYEPRIDELAALLRADAALDAARWQSHAWGNGSSSFCCPQTLDEAVDELKAYLAERRRLLFTGTVGGADELPERQPEGVSLQIGDVEVTPSSGNPDEEYIEVVNANDFAVDISDWTLDGAVSFRFSAGTVIPAHGTLYVAASRLAWRARAAPPHGGQGHLVTGDYKGRLSSRGGVLNLVDRRGGTVASKTVPASPSPAQSYLRIVELMYHPEARPGDRFDSEEYEFIVLRNIGERLLDLAGVRLTEGVSFDFRDADIRNLPPGGELRIVSNVEAFAERYGPAADVGGEYTGHLNNAGEAVVLVDEHGETILEFAYSDAWDPGTDGEGRSLVVVQPGAGYDTWNDPASWRPSDDD